ncbi:MAG: hypothetical protein N838_23950 [Thiohalocapsa sp. PB-PSB1]|nr:MAG: hypothetical protein N838_23950 [Thiohalocapsa sp. PB-PSB1]
MKIQRSTRQWVVVAATAAALAILQAPASATDCKGMEKKQCESNANCTWVDSYQRKDGIKVDGYCRGKGGKKSSSSKQSESQQSESQKPKKQAKQVFGLGVAC